MDFLYKGEPGWISSMLGTPWRINAGKIDAAFEVLLQKNGQWLPAATAGAIPGSVGEFKFTVPEELNAPGSILMLFLPFHALNKPAEELFEIPAGCDAQWSWPLLEIRTPASSFVLKNFQLPTQPQTLFFNGWLRTADDKFFELNEMPLVFEDTPAESLQVRVSSNFTDRTVRLSVTAEQSADARFMANRAFNGEITLEYNGKKHPCTLQGGNAVCRLPLEDDKPFTVKAFYPTLPQGESNYVDPAFLSDLGYRIVWGDMHVHSRESDGMGEAEEVMRRARDWKKLDFMAFNEHIEHSLSWRRWNQAKWEKLRKLYEESTVDNEFVIIPGFEYYSYCNLWCFNDEYHSYLAPEFNRDTEYYRIKRITTPEGKLQHEEVQRMIAQFAAKKDWMVGYHRLEVLKDQLGKLPTPVQMLQMAHYKRPPEVGSMDYLLRGDRVAFFGGTDTHLGMPATGYTGGRTANSGLTAVLVKELTRKSLHEALLNCRTYASLGARTLLDVRVNGAIMGSEISVPDGGMLEVTLNAAGSERLKGFEIVIDGEDVEKQSVDKTFACHTYRTTRKGSGKSFVLVRMHLEDGRMLWSSPVYIN